MIAHGAGRPRRGAGGIAERKMQLADAERVRGAGTAQVIEMLLAKGEWRITCTNSRP